MKKKILHFLTFIFVFCQSAICQNTQTSRLTNGIEDFTKFISSIDKSLVNLNEYEKIRKLYRSLGDILLDLQDIKKQKEKISTELNLAPDTSSFEFMDKNVLADVRVLGTSLHLLLSSLSDLQDALQENNLPDLGRIAQKLNVDASANDIRWVNIKKFTFGYGATLREVSYSKKVTDNACDSIVAVRGKILIVLETSHR